MKRLNWPPDGQQPYRLLTLRNSAGIGGNADGLGATLFRPYSAV